MFPLAKGFSVAFLLSFGIVHALGPKAYDELYDLGATCYPRDSCRYSQYDATQREGGKTCECDTFACHRRGTCCIDSPYVDPHPSTRKEICSGENIIGVHHNFHFTYLTGSTARKSYSFFQIAKCDSRWRGSVRVRQLCEVERGIHGSDIMTAIPVTNFVSGISYRNYFCALCNNDIQNSVLWDVSISEGDGGEYDISHRFVVQSTNDIYDAFDGIAYCTGSANPCSNRSAYSIVLNRYGGYYTYWGGYMENNEAIKTLTVNLSIPEEIKHHVKGCQPELISCCSPGWTDVRIKVLCESYYGIIKGPPRIDENGTYHDQYFRNAHCALCNNVMNFEDFSCEPFVTTPVLTPSYPTSQTIDFSQLLSHSGCLTEQEQFPQGLSCRAGICKNPQHKAENGECTL